MERWVDFDSELSVVAARGHDGTTEFYGPIANSHSNHILDISVTPTGLPESVANEAIEIARTIMTELNVVGVLCVEFFLASNGKLLVNVLVHIIPHLTVDMSVTSNNRSAICDYRTNTNLDHQQWPTS